MIPQANPIWDDPEMRPKGNTFSKFDKEGDEYSGAIAEITKSTIDDKTFPLLVLDNGDALSCSALNLHREVHRLRPDIGDWIRVVYRGYGDHGMKVFDVELQRSGTHMAPAAPVRRDHPRDEDEPVPEEDAPPDPYLDDHSGGWGTGPTGEHTSS